MLVVEVVVVLVEAPHGRLPTCCRCRSAAACRPLTGSSAPRHRRRRQNTCFLPPPPPPGDAGQVTVRGARGLVAVRGHWYGGAEQTCRSVSQVEKEEEAAVRMSVEGRHDTARSWRQHLPQDISVYCVRDR